MKLFSPFIFISILSITSSALIMNCSSDDSQVATDTPEPEPEIPVEVTVSAPSSLSGIWQGTMTQATNTYDVSMIFYMPEGTLEGRVMGIATNRSTGAEKFLIDAGYQKVTNINWDYDYLVGKDGSQGTFMKYFDFDKNLVGAKRGSIALDLADSTLAGTASLEDLNDFDIVLEYSLQNASETTMADLAGTWSDAINGWDDAATGVTLTVNPVNSSIFALATGASTCQGSGVASDIADYNIYTFNGATINSGVILSNCGTRVTNAGTPQQTTELVDGNYDGMGMIIEDGAGNTTLSFILSSTLLKTPSMAIFNQFVKN